MTKYELAKLFSDVDDKYIEGARPVAQKAVMIKTSKSPMRIISAASCAAVLVGGIITITAVHNRDISALNDSNTASITSGGANISNSTDIKDSTEMTDSTVSLDERSDNYFTSDHICYEGEYYTVVKDASEYGVHITLDMWHITFATGIRISSDNTIDVVTVIKNISNMPIGMLDIGDSSGIRLGFHKKSEGNQPGISGTDAEKHVTKVLQPGEELYEKQSFDLFYGECWGTLQFDYGDLDGAHIDPDSEKNLVFTGEMTEDGFKEHNEAADKWAQKPLVLPSKFAPKDLDFVYTGNGLFSHNTLIPAEIGSEVYAVDDGEVVFAKYDNMYNAGCGSFVFIKHGEGLYTLYAGLLPVEEGGKAYVSAGDNVMAGTVIGLAGNSGLQREYGVSYGYYTELPEFFKFIKGLVNTDSSSSGEELDLTTDADGDGIPDKLKELNPDVTDEQWELYKKLEHPEEYGLVQIGEDSVTDGEYGITTKFFVGPVEE